MKSTLSSRSTWVGATGVALALAAGLVLGNGGSADAPDAGSPSTPAAAAPPARESAARPAAPALSLDRLRRHVTVAEPATDLFAGMSWAPPAPAPPPPAPPPPPAAPPEPVAPPLPFVFVGQFAEEGQSPQYYLEHGAKVLTLAPGAGIDGTWQFVGRSGNELEFIYLPLNTRQTIRMPE